MGQVYSAGSARGALCCLCILAALAGCAGRDRCDKPGAYARSASGPPLRVPADLSAPRESDAFEVPADVTGGSSPPCGHYPPKLAGVTNRGADEPAEPAPGAAPAEPPPPPVEPTVTLPPPAPAPAPEPAPPATVSPQVEAELRSFVEAWAQSWAAGDFDQYLQYYSRSFDPPGELTLEEWETARRGRLEKHPTTTVFTDTLTVQEASADRVFVQFVQRSELDGIESSLRKGLVLVREDGAWRIQREIVVEVLLNPR